MKLSSIPFSDLKRLYKNGVPEMSLVVYPDGHLEWEASASVRELMSYNPGLIDAVKIQADDIYSWFYGDGDEETIKQSLGNDYFWQEFVSGFQDAVDDAIAFEQEYENINSNTNI